MGGAHARVKARGGARARARMAGGARTSEGCRRSSHEGECSEQSGEARMRARARATLIVGAGMDNSDGT